MILQDPVKKCGSETLIRSEKQLASKWAEYLGEWKLWLAFSQNILNRANY